MTGEKNEKILFEAELNWIEKKKGLLSATEAAGAIHVATPPAFGGEGRYWTPEHLFLGSISSCFMTTFLAFAEKFGFSISHFACPAIGQIGIQNGKYRFLSIELYPRIIIEDDSFREKAVKAIEKTQHYCIISNAVEVPIVYNSEVFTEHPVNGQTLFQ